MTNPYLKRTIHRHNVASPHLDHAREFLVYLPPGYDERQTYPVVYCQDGREFFNLGRIATIANKLILDEGWRPSSSSASPSTSSDARPSTPSPAT